MQKSAVLSLQMRRESVNHRLKTVEQDLLRDFQELTAPPQKSATRVEDIISQGMRVWTVIDGAMMGYKLMKRIGNVSTFWKRKKK